MGTYVEEMQRLGVREGELAGSDGMVVRRGEKRMDEKSRESGRRI